MAGEFIADDPYWWKEIDIRAYDACWGGETAAAKYTNHLKPKVATVYLPEQARTRLLRDARLRKATTWTGEQTGTVLIYRPFCLEQPDGLAMEAKEVLVHPVLVYADLVTNWVAFETLGEQLREQGFKATPAQHCLISPLDAIVDIVPFVHVEDEQTTIAWPPKGETEMNVLGFREACENAEWVRIQDDPVLDVPVANLAGMVLLEIIAWTDRAGDLRRKDAVVIVYLLSTYELIPSNRSVPPSF